MRMIRQLAKKGQTWTAATPVASSMQTSRRQHCQRDSRRSARSIGHCCSRQADQPRGRHSAHRLIEDVWSALEYACHVRDVFLVQRDRLYTALVEDTPTFTPMYRDQRVTLPVTTRRTLRRLPSSSPPARLIAQAFDMLDSAQLQRRCIYNFQRPLSAHCSGSVNMRSTKANTTSAISRGDCLPLSSLTIPESACPKYASRPHSW